MEITPRVVGAVGFVLAVGLMACANGTPSGPSGLSSADDLMRDLRAQGLIATRGGTVPADAFPFFAVRPVRLVVNGEDVNVFEYSAEGVATSDAAKVAPSGTPIGASQVTWISAPRFYRKDRLIVLYVGTNQTVARALTAVMGKPFAGITE